MKEPSGIGPHTLTPMDRLVGRPVVDRDGKLVGRIHELRADVTGDDWTITHFLVGVGGLLERLGVVLTLMVGGKGSPYVVPVDQVDLSDSRQARLRSRRSELRRE
jgi:sporulation protein YlmC with PRC-barrel domain